MNRALWIAVTLLAACCVYLVYRVHRLGATSAPTYHASPAVEADPGSSPPAWLLNGSDEATLAFEQRLRSIMLPSMEFRDADIADIVNFLVASSANLDPDGQGINIVLDVNGADLTHARPKITMNLRNIPMLYAIKYIAEVADFTFHVDAHAVIISDK